MLRYGCIVGAWGTRNSALTLQKRYSVLKHEINLVLTEDPPGSGKNKQRITLIHYMLLFFFCICPHRWYGPISPRVVTMATDGLNTRVARLAAMVSTYFPPNAPQGGLNIVFWNETVTDQNGHKIYLLRQHPTAGRFLPDNQQSVGRLSPLVSERHLLPSSGAARTIHFYVISWTHWALGDRVIISKV